MNAAGFTDYTIESDVYAQLGVPSASIPINTGTPDVNGSYWWLNGEVEGWDSPEGRVTMLSKLGVGPSADGEFAADLHYKGRTINMKLICECPTEADRQASRYLISQVMDLVRRTGTFTVNEEIPKNITISRAGNSNAGKLKLTDLGLSTPIAKTPPLTGLPTGERCYLFEADVEFYSTDPRKYAVTQSRYDFFLGNALPENIGNAESVNLVIALNGTDAYGSQTIDQFQLFIETFVGSTGFSSGGFGIPLLPPFAPSLPSWPVNLVIDSYNKVITDRLPEPGLNYYYLRNLQQPWPTLVPGVNNFRLVDQNGSIQFLNGQVYWYSAWI